MISRKPSTERPVLSPPSTLRRARPLAHGRVRVAQGGFGLLRLGNEDVFIGSGCLGSAIDGDRIVVEITSQGPRGRRGKVVRVLERGRRRVTGIVDESGVFIPDHPYRGRPLRCETLPCDPQAPMLWAAELLPDVPDFGAEVALVRCFGTRGSPRAEEDAILWRERLDAQFAPAALAEAEARASAVYDEPSSQRLDLRAIAFITIDSAKADDHDHAVFAERLFDGSIRVCVAIADVAAFVRAGGPLDVEASRRGGSLYLPGQVVPMLPRILCNDAASLLPSVDRAALVLDIRLDRDLRIESKRLVRALIHSRAKLTYEQVVQVLQKRGLDGSDSAELHTKTVELVDEVAQGLGTRRRERGAVVVESPDVRLEVDEATGLRARVASAARDPWLLRSRQMVEELMLLANETVAGILSETHAPVLYRSRDAPADERVMRVIERARRRGLLLDVSVTLEASALEVLARAASSTDGREDLARLLLDTDPGALSSTRRQDPFALASRRNVRFTSPIRRYADLAAHRAIGASLDGTTDAPHVDDSLVKRTQRRIRRVQQEVSRLYAALLMQGRIGETFAGTTALRTEQFWLVVLENPAISVRCMGLDPALERGARVTVRIRGVSLAMRTIDASAAAREK